MSQGGPDPPRSVLDWFIHSEVAGSVVLIVCAAAAMVWANSPWAERYGHLAHATISIGVGSHVLALSLQHWINDALMVVFFFVVGLEIKRELVAGHLSSARRAVLPVAAAVGGMLCPAAIYAGFNRGGPGADGWGIPMATDIAFALGILALLGRRVPIGLKVFLTALAIADDLGAVLVIALFYTAEIRWAPLGITLACLVVLGLVIQAGLRHPVFYAVLVISVWLSVFASGVHTTVAGVLMAMLVPVRPRLNPTAFFARVSDSLGGLRAAELTRDSVLTDEAQLDALTVLDDAATDMRPPGLTLERFFHPLQTLFILPLFALVNAGVSLDGRAVDVLIQPVALGVIAGLVVGKVIGIGLASWLVVRGGFAELPEAVTWRQVLGAGLLGGVGFTMSLFVSELALDTEALLNVAKIGILVASLAAGAAGYLVLRWSLPARAN